MLPILTLNTPKIIYNNAEVKINHRFIHCFKFVCVVSLWIRVVGWELYCNTEFLRVENDVVIYFNGDRVIFQDTEAIESEEFDFDEMDLCHISL